MQCKRVPSPLSTMRVAVYVLGTHPGVSRTVEIDRRAAPEVHLQSLHDDTDSRLGGISDDGSGADVARPQRDRRAWLCYARWLGINLLVFHLLYPPINWLTSRRHDTLALYLPWELDIPFLPGWAWIYFSMNLLLLLPPLFLDERQLRLLGRRCLMAILIAATVFLLLPAKLGFARVVPDQSIYGQAFSWLFAYDLPHNLVPSLHVALSAICIASFIWASSSPALRGALWIWLAAICASTTLVHQHHLLDVTSGLALAWIVLRLRLPETRGWAPGLPART